MINPVIASPMRKSIFSFFFYFHILARFNVTKKKTTENTVPLIMFIRISHFFAHRYGLIDFFAENWTIN